MKKLLLVLLGSVVVCSMYAQQPSIIGKYEGYYDKAVEANRNGKIDDACRYLKLIIDNSKELEKNKDLKELLKWSKDLYNRIDFLKVSDDKLNISPYGDFKEIIVDTHSAWDCTSSVEWCKIVEKTRNYIKIWCDENPDFVSRTGNIIISKGDKSVRIEVEQDPGKEKKGRVYVRTQPHNATLTTDGYMGYSSSPLVLGIGTHRIKVSKEGYSPKETEIIVQKVADTTIMVDVTLEPLFGKLRPIIIDQHGRPIEQVDFKVGKHFVDIFDYTNSHSFDDSQPIVHYAFYNEGVIPLNPATYEIYVSAKGYQPHTQKVVITPGQTTDVKIVMRSMDGKLAIVDGGNATGARVSIPELMTHAKVGDTINVVQGIWTLNVYKKGYRWDNAQNNVEIIEGKTTEYKVRMTRQADLYVSTPDHKESVYINGEKLKFQESYYSHQLDEGETYKLDIKKDGYWHYVEDITVGKDDVVIDRRNIELEPAATLILSSDETVNVELKRKGDATGQNYAEDKVLLSDIKNKKDAAQQKFYIPKGKYNVTLRRLDPNNEMKTRHRIAYEGVVNLNDSLKRRRLRTWLIPNFGSFSVLDIEYNLTHKSIMSSGKIPLVFKANFLDFPLVKGLSTSIGEGAIVYTRGRTDFPVDYPADAYRDMVPAISLPFMNYDFRIGGGIGQYLDISALMSYTYYLQYDRILSKQNFKNYSPFMDHFEGHDAFIGLELSSRLRGFNMYLRAGLQYLNGDRCYVYGYELRNEQGNGIDWVDKFEMIKMKQTAFVVNVGFNIGHFGVKRKGHNILRVF